MNVNSVYGQHTRIGRERQLISTTCQRKQFHLFRNPVEDSITWASELRTDDTTRKTNAVETAILLETRIEDIRE